jgi:hypothetical protein
MTRRPLPCLALAIVLGCSDDEAGGACELEDLDGIIGGAYTFALHVDDIGFEPRVIAVQNTAEITLTLTNDASTTSGFSIDCLATPNQDGCPAQSCFPDSHLIAPVAPGASATVHFRVPEVEGIYSFRALAEDDLRTGQIVVQ